MNKEVENIRNNPELIEKYLIEEDIWMKWIYKENRMDTIGNILTIIYLIICGYDFIMNKSLNMTEQITRIVAYVVVYLILKKLFSIIAKIIKKIIKAFKGNNKKTYSHNYNWYSNKKETNKSNKEHTTKYDAIPESETEVEYEYIDEDDKLYGYESSKPIATKTEKEFYKRLKEYCNRHNYIINLKTRLEDLVNYVDGMDYGLTQKYRGQIKSRHVDYLILDQELQPLFAIELDDDSHLKAKAKEIDKFKDDFFNKIGIKLYRVPADDFLWKMELEKIFIEDDTIVEQEIPYTNEQNVSDKITD